LSLAQHISETQPVAWAVLVFLGMVIGTVSVSLATGDWEGDALRLISYAAAIATYEAVIALEKLLEKDEQ
jgi:hypothetical protein